MSLQKPKPTAILLAFQMVLNHDPPPPAPTIPSTARAQP